MSTCAQVRNSVYKLIEVYTPLSLLVQISELMPGGRTHLNNSPSVGLAGI